MYNRIKMEELYHHGVKGQRWGFRRYQNADGSLTPAGKKRYGTKANFEKVQKAKLVAKGKDPKTQREKAREKANARTEKELAKYRKKSGIKDEPETQQQKKTMKDFSNEELKAMTDRMTIEKNYIDAKRNLASVKPQKVNKGKEFAKDIFENAIKPAAVNAGKAYLEKAMKEALGIKPDEMELLKKEAEKAGYKKKIYEARDAAYKNLQNERKEQEYQDKLNSDKSNQQAAEDNQSRSKEQYEKETSYKSGGYSKTSFTKGTIKSDIIDAMFNEDKPANKEKANEGQKYIGQLLLLEDKKMKHRLTDENELYHHGVKGQKWGIRRYQNADGTLTAAGKKRQKKTVASDKKATIVKGTNLYRVSDKNKSDTSENKMYVSATKDSGDFYVTKLGSSKIYKTGKAFVHTYIATKDLKLPDKKTMEKIELGLLKDKQVQKELVDSLMKKGLSREQATDQVRSYSYGKAFVDKIKFSTISGISGAFSGGMLGGGTGTLQGIGVGAAVGGALGFAGGLASKSHEKERALNVARMSYGDINNKVTNSKLQNELAKKGYNAMKDYNDRRAFGKNGEQAIIVFDSKNNAKIKDISEVTSKEYGKAYAKEYLKQHPNSKLDYEDLVKDGEADYKKVYESGVIDREREKENKRLLEKASKRK